MRRSLEISWDVLDIVIGGKSSIDSTEGFRISSMEEATRFLESYGYNADNPVEMAEAQGHFREAVQFIQKYFLGDPGAGVRREIPRKILEIVDVRELLLFAGLSYPKQTSDAAGMLLRDWACSVLKVMHTIAHLDQDLRTSYFSQIQTQILDRFYKVVHRDEHGGLFLGESEKDGGKIPLVSFETKPKKTRESILIKLLHKPENVAEDIFDRVGIRFVTHDLVSVLEVVQFLRDKMIIVAPNLKPSRSRNTLIRMDVVKEALTAGKSLESIAGQLSLTSGSAENPHSSTSYRSIQFTARQLIKLRNPLYDQLRELRRQKSVEGSDQSRLIQKLDLNYVQKELHFFYPFEVQIVDQASHIENERGRSAHAEYKKAQLVTAKRRVLGKLNDIS